LFANQAGPRGFFRESALALILLSTGARIQVIFTGKKKPVPSIFTDLCAPPHGSRQAPAVESVSRGGFQRLVLRCDGKIRVLNAARTSMRRPALTQAPSSHVTA
jgi:hypothetical protein